MDAEFERRIKTESLEDLYDIRDHIAQEAYPDRYAAVLDQIDLLASDKTRVDFVSQVGPLSGIFAFSCPYCGARTIPVSDKLRMGRDPSLRGFNTRCGKCGQAISPAKWGYLVSVRFFYLWLILLYPAFLAGRYAGVDDDTLLAMWMSAGMALDVIIGLCVPLVVVRRIGEK